MKSQLTMAFDALRDCARVGPLIDVSTQRTIVLAFLLRHVGAPGADAIELYEPYLQARFDDRARRTFSTLGPRLAYKLVTMVAAGRVVFSSTTPALPRALENVCEDKRVPSFVFLLWAARSAGDQQECTELVALEGGHTSRRAVRGLMAWVSSLQSQQDGVRKLSMFDVVENSLSKIRL